MTARRVNPNANTNADPIKEIAGRIRKMPYLDMMEMAKQIGETEVGEEGDESTLSETVSPSWIADLLTKWATAKDKPPFDIEDLGKVMR